MPSLALAFAVLLALPAVGRAADPLLSGYGGPGGGQQVLLGSHLLGRHGGGSGGSGGAAATPASLRAPAPAQAQAAVTPTQGTAAAPPASGSAPARSAGHAQQQRGHRAQGGASAGQAAAAPRRIAYPARADDAGGFPLSASEVVAGLLVLLAAAGMGAWMRRAVTRGGDGPQAAM